MSAHELWESADALIDRYHIAGTVESEDYDSELDMLSRINA